MNEAEKKSGLGAYFAQLQVDTNPAFQHALRVEDTFQEAEDAVSSHLARMAIGTKTSFDALLNDFRAKRSFDEREMAEEVAVARGIWNDLVQEVEANPLPKEVSGKGRFSLKFGCKACKLTVAVAFIGAGGLMGVLAAYSAGTAVPAYFAAVAAALKISITALYAILGAVVAGTISVSDVPREICRERGKC